jgi:hypothetical protein
MAKSWMPLLRLLTSLALKSWEQSKTIEPPFSKLVDMMEEMIYQELVTQVIFSYPDETIDAITDYFDEELDYILQVYDRSTRYAFLAEELVEMLLLSADSPAVDLIISIFARYGIEARRMPAGAQQSYSRWGGLFNGYIQLGPISVAMGVGQERSEDEDMLNAAESLCRLRLTRGLSPLRFLN